ncbi:MAG: hypothetical protein ACTHJJ_04630 [Intrasporangium sp.]|uniref:hypothetical protein n=1 Tax=Intrasporangium sp. TaxID=1925024 RepID=UPI003F7DD62F
MTTNPHDAPPPPEPYRYAAVPAPEATSHPRWSAGRTAAVAGVTIVLVSAGAIGAAAALPLGGDRGGSQGFPGGGQFPRSRNGFGQNGLGQNWLGQQQNGLGQNQNGVGQNQNGFGRQQNGAQLPPLPSLGGRGSNTSDDGVDTTTT